MSNNPRRTLIASLTACLISLPVVAETTPDIEGLWAAYKRFDVYQQGPLLLDFDTQQAELAGERVPIKSDGTRWSATFSSERGSFYGQAINDSVLAHWHQPAAMQTGAQMATPVRFNQQADGLWRGTFTPMPSQFTFYLPVTRDDDGVFRTYLKNPERNLGIFAQVDRVAFDEEGMRLVGKFRGTDEEQTLTSGHFNPEFDTFTQALPPWRGGTFEFYRVEDPLSSNFNARPASAGPWQYVPPPNLDDSWPVSTLSAENIREAPIKAMIDDVISKPASDIHDLDVHGVLIARNGKLVLEEYFHGFNRDMPHDTRSAGKSLGSTLVGAAMAKGVDISPATPVFAALGEDTNQLDDGKAAMTLEHLLTMSSGFYCDDGDGAAPGNENTMQSQTDQPDWYRYTLDLPMAYEPGVQAIYCSVNSNLIGAVVSAAAGQPLTELVQTLVADPLQIETYHLNQQPTGELYLGGGSYWLPRDFMKLPQLMLNGGRWNGEQVVSEEWARQSTSTAVQIGERDYAWQWWVSEYDWHGRTVKAFFAAGNGGQIFMGIPEADLVVAFWGGNYSDAAGRIAQRELIPNFILPAVLND